MKRRTQGIFVILIPVILIGVILLSFVVVNTLLQSAPIAAAAEPITAAPETITNTSLSDDTLIGNTRVIMNYALGFLGIVSFTMLLPFLIAGIYLIANGPKISARLRKDLSVQQLQEEEVAYIDNLSWGAFFGSTVWALSTGLYWWALGTIVPLFNIYVFFRLWIFGREMSWKALQPISFQAFKRRQMIAALIVLLFIMSFTALGYFVPEVLI